MEGKACPCNLLPPGIGSFCFGPLGDQMVHLPSLAGGPRYPLCGSCQGHCPSPRKRAHLCSPGPQVRSEITVMFPHCASSPLSLFHGFSPTAVVFSSYLLSSFLPSSPSSSFSLFLVLLYPSAFPFSLPGIGEATRESSTPGLEKPRSPVT